MTNPFSETEGLLQSAWDNRYKISLFFILLSTVALAITNLLYIQYGHGILTDAYYGKSYDLISGFMGSKDEHPLSFYINKADRIIIGLWVLLGLTTAFIFSFRAPLQYRPLLLLVIVDFILLLFSEMFGGIFGIRKDGSIPEWFQYIKELLLAFIFFKLYVYNKKGLFLVFTALFLFLFVDDAFRYHERAGTFICNAFNLPDNLFGIPAKGQDVAEILSLILPGIILIPPLLIFYVRSPKPQKVIATNVFGLLVLLFCAGVLLAFIHSLFRSTDLYHFLGILEDFSEMLVMSWLCHYAISLYRQLRQRKPEVLQ